MDSCTICDQCGKNVPGIQEFSEFSHITSCTEEGIKGRVRQSWKPVFKNKREICFPCRKVATRKYVAETQMLNQEK